MKPKPISSMQVATSAGESSMSTPRASSTSADPDLLVATYAPTVQRYLDGDLPTS